MKVSMFIRLAALAALVGMAYSACLSCNDLPSKAKEACVLGCGRKLGCAQLYLYQRVGVLSEHDFIKACEIGKLKEEEYNLRRLQLEVSREPTANPTISPTPKPTVNPTVSPTLNPTFSPTSSPTDSDLLDFVEDNILYFGIGTGVLLFFLLCICVLLCRCCCCKREKRTEFEAYEKDVAKPEGLPLDFALMSPRKPILSTGSSILNSLKSNLTLTRFYRNSTLETYDRASMGPPAPPKIDNTITNNPSADDTTIEQQEDAQRWKKGQPRWSLGSASI